MVALGIWVNRAREWLHDPHTFVPYSFTSLAEATTFLARAGYINSTRDDVQMSAYVAELPPGQAPEPKLLLRLVDLHASAPANTTTRLGWDAPQETP